MQFLRILFWCLLVFLGAVFTFGNWTAVPINLPAGTVAYVILPLLLLVAFLIGLVPTLLYQHAVRWRLRQRLASCERSLAEMRALAAIPPAAVLADLPTPVSIHPGATAPASAPSPVMMVEPSASVVPPVTDSIDPAPVVISRIDLEKPGA